MLLTEMKIRFRQSADAGWERDQAKGKNAAKQAGSMQEQGEKAATRQQ